MSTLNRYDYQPTLTHNLKLPPRQAMALPVLAKLQAKEPLTQEDQRLVILALPRKERRRLKVRTTPFRSEIAGLRQFPVVDPEREDAEASARKQRNFYKKTRKARR